MGSCALVVTHLGSRLETAGPRDPRLWIAAAAAVALLVGGKRLAGLAFGSRSQVARPPPPSMIG